MTVYISAPFGNYIRTKSARSVIGSFTLHHRPGLLQQVAKTLRYRNGAWYNALGLRNPGIVFGLRYYYRSGNVVSLAAVEPGDWEKLDEIVPDDIDVELNLSCPNIDHFQDYSNGAEIFLNTKRKVIAKLSPLITATDVENLYERGFRSFHCCNTMPTEHGGMSGKGLRIYVEQTIDFIQRIDPNCDIIAGGGIETINDVMNYYNAGATSFALGTVCFNPLKLRKLLRELNG